MAPPDLADTTIFPTFADCPEPSPSSSSTPTQPWYLLGQVTHDMTITKPTLVLADRSGAPFALVFDGHGHGHGRLAPPEARGLDLRARGLRRGATAVVPMAERTPPAAEGGNSRGFVRVPAGAEDVVGAVPGPLERVVDVAGRMRAGDGGACGRCGGEGEGGGEGGKVVLRRCTGCGEVRYCSKVSFSTW